ncbi:MAG: hypothetical protein LBQ27_06555, partial [Clostridiales bacterium]|nr:hypothetical protein [Clostridiales bacterium]
MCLKYVRKKSIFKYVFLFFCFLLFFSVFFNAQADAGVNAEKSADEIEKELDENTDKNLNGLDLSELDAFIASLGGGLIRGSVKDYIKKIIDGDFGSGSEAVFNIAKDIILKDIAAILPMVAGIVIICLLSGFVSGVSSNFLRKSTREIIFFVCYALIILLLLNHVTGYISDVKGLLNNLSRLM